MAAQSLPRWRAFHFHYHERQNHLLEHLLRPLVVSLLNRGEIDSFFFVRFLLGGPHVRLRLRLCGDRLSVAEAVQAAAERFFDASPSRATLPEGKIHEMTRGILKSDASEQDDAIYPDNFLRPAPFHPEVERYGGPELLPESLAFSAVSSCQVLRFVHQCAGDPGPRLLSFAFHLLGSQAFGLARSCREFLDLLRFPVTNWEAAPSLLVQRGDQAFEQQTKNYLRALRHRIEDRVEGRAPVEDSMAERTLEGLLRGVAARHRILSSHLHMTANRLGLKSGEEIYLARLLWRTATELASSNPTLWSRLEGFLGEQAGARSLEDCLPATLEALGDEGGPASEISCRPRR